MIKDKKTIDRLLAEYGSPLYIFREDDFIENYKTFYNAMKTGYDKYRLSYSYKTNYAPYIAGLVKKLGGYAEVVSDMEYSIAKKVGYEDRQIIYNGPIKGELGYRMMLNGGMLNVDNLEELKYVCSIAQKNENDISIGLRLNIDIGQSFISRFGIDTDSDDLQKAIAMINDQGNLHLRGLHCHIGQSRSPQSWQNRARRMLEIVGSCFKDLKLEYIDLGSGMFARMEKSLADQFGGSIPSYEDYAQAVGSVFSGHYKDCSYEDRPLLFTEPGTTLINSYIDFVAEVSSIKHIKGKSFVVLNCSKHNLGEICTLKRMPIEIIRNSKETETLSNADFVGYTCLEHDVMYKGFNGELGVGDYIVFGNTGGYSNVSKPPFISPNCAMVSENGILIKKAEDFDDVLRTYQWEIN
ncbi:MAG: alanine racemase [Erysipelotrichaceae bacterium]|nr:alanine racemase [Erysipelotrichaceae bacterium]